MSLETLAVTRPLIARANGGATGSFTETTTTDFGAVCAVLTNTAVSPALGGEVRLTPTLEDYFDGASVINTSLWITGTATDFYTVPITVTGGVVTLNSNFLRAQSNFQAFQPRFYEARVQERVNGMPPGNTVIGFARENRPGDPITDTSASRMFIGPNASDMYVRWRDGLTGADLAVSPNPDLTQYHVFRIEWEPAETRFYIDNVLTTTLSGGISTLNTWAWLYTQDPDMEMNVDWIRAGQYAANGTYISCARDAGGVVNWSTLTATMDTPAGTSLAMHTRTSLDNTNWTAWSAPMTSTLITSPSGRYLQYRAEMTATNRLRSPELQQVRVGYFGAATLQVTPGSVTLDPGATQQFNAQAYDVNGRAISSLNYTWGIINGGGSLNATGLFTAALTPGTYLNTISATVQTTAGPVTGLGSVTVRDLAPTASAGGPYSVSEGVTTTVSGTGTDPNGLPVILDWDLDNNGSFETLGQSSAPFYRGDNGIFAVRLRVTEDGGAALSTTVTTTVTVTNVAPTATFSATPTSLSEGSSFTLVLTDPFDLGETDRLVGFTYSFDCGGGGGYGSFGVSNLANCGTGDNGVRTVRGRIQDKDGGIGEYSRTVTVTNVAPVVAIVGAPGSSPEGTAITLTSVVTDAGTLDTHSYVWSVTKDSSPYASGTAAAFSFTPNDNGTYVVSLTATDDDGASGEDSRVIVVMNAPPTATYSATPASTPEGSSFDLTFTGAADVSSVDTAAGFTYSFDCGGGYGSFGVSNIAACGTSDDEVRTVRGRIQDKDGGIGEYTRTVTVTNVVPAVSIVGAPGSGVEGTTITVTSMVTDVGVLDTHTYGWGVTKDGSPYASGTAAGFSFTPNDNGTYVLSLTATDDDGGVGTAPNVTVTVTNVAPAVVINGAPSIGIVGATITLTNTVTDPGSQDTFTYAWSVTKDGNPFASGTASSFSFTPDGAGAYAVTLVVTDKDGDTANALVTITGQYQVLLPLIMRFSP